MRNSVQGFGGGDAGTAEPTRSFSVAKRFRDVLGSRGSAFCGGSHPEWPQGMTGTSMRSRRRLPLIDPC
jgi:hypothetical protein